MRREKLTKKELDELGKRLVIAAKPSDDEVDRLVSNPRLYDGVLAKIAAESRPPREARKGFAYKPAATAAMAVALLSVPLLVLLKYSGVNDPVASRLRVLPYKVEEKPLVPVPEQIDQPAARDERELRPIPAVMTRAAEVPATAPPPTVKAARPRPPRVRYAEPSFVPIGLPERAEEAAIDGRVVRVEMPRSALFAMGVDVPLENGTRSVKAELLVGPDGSPRAIRLVE